MSAELTSTLGEMPDPVALEAEADKLERKARALRQIAEGFKALNGDAAALVFGTTPGANGAYHGNGKAEGPQGREAVRLVVAERPGIWKLSDLKAEAKRRGFPVSDNGVEKAVRRMLEGGEAKKAGYGRYRFAKRKEVAIESESSAAAMIADD